MGHNLGVLFIRWLHIIAGITWIGHLYFFNFVNIPFQGDLDDATKKSINSKLMLRALWWFRWGAMVTFIAGLLLFVMLYMGGGLLRDDTGGVSARAMWIMMGMLFGTIMWFNVWFIIWPAQKSIFAGQVPPDQVPAVRARAALASRINTYLSGPMLVGMVTGSHPEFSGDFAAVPLVALLAVALASIWAAYFHSTKVGKSV